MQLYEVQLKPGHDLLAELKRFVAERDIDHAAIVSAVGSLSVAQIRAATIENDPVEPLVLRENLEIVSMAGRLSRHQTRTFAHLHLAVADVNGAMTGGHVRAGCIVRLGAKIVVVSAPDMEIVEVAPLAPADSGDG